jgi:hypothetical protein
MDFLTLSRINEYYWIHTNAHGLSFEYKFSDMYQVVQHGSYATHIVHVSYVKRHTCSNPLTTRLCSI